MTAMQNRGNHAVPTTAVRGSDAIWKHHQEGQAHRRAVRDSHPEHHGIIEQLDHEWSRLATRTTTTQTLERWGLEYPALGGCAESADPITLIQSSAPERRDAMFVALLTYTTANDDRQGDDREGAELATLMTLKLMLPRVVRLARSLTHVPEASDREAIAVASMYEAIGTYRTDKHPTRVPITLARAATHIAQERHTRPGRDLQAAATEVLDDFTELDWIDEAEPSARDELRQLVQWAVDQRILHPDEAVELLHGNGRGAAEARARLRGVSSNTIHKTRWRALHKLAHAVSESDADLEDEVSRAS